MPPPRICFFPNKKGRGGWLEKELKLLRPKLIITLGTRDLRYFIPQVESLTSCVGKDLSWNETKLLALLHPLSQTIAWRAQDKRLFTKALAKLQKTARGIIN